MWNNAATFATASEIRRASAWPGYTTASNQGMFDGLPGYVDPRQANHRAFASQLPDTRRRMPVGYHRQATGEDEWR